MVREEEGRKPSLNDAIFVPVVRRLLQPAFHKERVYGIDIGEASLKAVLLDVKARHVSLEALTWLPAQECSTPSQPSSSPSCHEKFFHSLKQFE